MKYIETYDELCARCVTIMIESPNITHSAFFRNVPGVSLLSHRFNELVKHQQDTDRNDQMLNLYSARLKAIYECAVNESK